MVQALVLIQELEREPEVLLEMLQVQSLEPERVTGFV